MARRAPPAAARTASSIETCTAERPQVPAGGASYEELARYPLG